MKTCIVILSMAAAIAAQSSMGGGGMGAMSGPGNQNFNLSTTQGILGFLNMEGINPSAIVTSNCVSNGNSCTPGGQPCCLSPVFTCQSASASNRCMVVPAHTPHIPQIKQIVQTMGISTQNPIQG